MKTLLITLLTLFGPLPGRFFLTDTCALSRWRPTTPSSAISRRRHRPKHEQTKSMGHLQEGGLIGNEDAPVATRRLEFAEK